MMQAVLQQHLGTTFLVESAGLRKELAGRPANYRSVACMKERGVDLSGHISRWIGDLDLELGMAGYRDCLALLDQVMPQVAQRIRDA